MYFPLITATTLLVSLFWGGCLGNSDYFAHIKKPFPLYCVYFNKEDQMMKEIKLMDQEQRKLWA